MKMKYLYTVIVTVLFLVTSCEREVKNSIPEIGDEVLALVEEEIIADNNAAEILAEADDGLFWGDTGFSFLKSGDKNRFNCASMDFSLEENKMKLTLEFSGEDCNKTGSIIIEYIKPEDAKRFASKSITYIDFSHGKGAVFNGTQSINRENGNYKTESDITVKRVNDEGDEIILVRQSSKEIEWICGPSFGGNNISKVTGQSSVSKSVNGEQSLYNREITEPLLIVKDCGFKVQAGVVNISKPDGTKVAINYGIAPEDFSCDAVFDCDNTIDVTNDGVTETLTVEEGKRLKRWRE